MSNKYSAERLQEMASWFLIESSKRNVGCETLIVRLTVATGMPPEICFALISHLAAGQDVPF